MVDRDEIESWLQQRPREDAEIIAQRAAIRAMPFYYGYLDERSSISEFQPALPILRCLLVAGVSREFAEPECTAAAERAVSSIEGVSPFLANSSTYAAMLAAQASSYGYSSMGYPASDAAQVAALASEASSVLARDFSDAVVRDLQEPESALRLRRVAVWYDDTPELWNETEQRALQWLAIETGDPNSFWHRWWRGVVSGEWLDWNLQREVALIPDDIWQQGPKAVMVTIAEIEARRAARHDLHDELAKLPRPSQQVVAAVQQAMQHNRDALPPTFDAIQGLVTLEIERLLKRNYTDDLDQQECQRQISVYLALYDAVCALRDNLPATGPVTLEQATTSEGLLHLYWNKIKQLPREKVDEVVEGVWGVSKGVVTLGLISTSTVMAMSYGISPAVGAAMAGMVFAPKSVGDVVKAAREALGPKP